MDVPAHNSYYVACVYCVSQYYLSMRVGCKLTASRSKCQVRNLRQYLSTDQATVILKLHCHSFASFEDKIPKYIRFIFLILVCVLFYNLKYGKLTYTEMSWDIICPCVSTKDNMLANSVFTRNCLYRCFPFFLK